MFLNDPNVVSEAPTLSALVGCAAGDEEMLSDRARGTMLGLAVGNLLGLPMEGWSSDTIEKRYPDGVIDIDPSEAYSPMDDDLAQAVDLGEALLQGGDYVDEFAGRLVAWRHENGRGIGFTTARVISKLETGHRPPEAARIVYSESPIAPNGGVMRCAPVALARFRDPELLVRDSAATCVVTHYAQAAQWSCVIINAVIALLLRGVSPDLKGLMNAAREDGCPDLLAIAQGDGIPSEVLESVSGGQPVAWDASWLRGNQNLIGHTLIALQTGLWAAVTLLEFEAALRDIVEAGGDTDTNGAVVGAVLGARYGVSGIPGRWFDVVPERERIVALADGLAGFSA